MIYYPTFRTPAMRNSILGFSHKYVVSPYGVAKIITTENTEADPMTNSYQSEFASIAFIGRKGEQETLRRRLKETQAGHGCSIFIRGAPGIGKTRLALTILEELPAPWLILSGKAYGERLWAYEPFVEVVRSLRRRRIPFSEDELERLMKPYLPQLNALFPGVVPCSTDLPPISAVNLYFLFEGVLQFFLKLSDDHPLCLFLDNAHWMDVHSIQLFAYIARRITHFPIALIACYREGEMGEEDTLAQLVYALRREDAACCLTLSQLDKDETQQLLGVMLNIEASDIPDVLTESLYSQTLGNPFFVKQSVLGLLESGSLAIVNGIVHFRPEKRAPLTDDLRFFIMERVHRLAKAERETLELASVLGESFPLILLQQMTDLELTQLEGSLHTLIIRRFLGPRRENVDEMEFYHPKIQEVVYDSLPSARKRSLHGAVAARLENGSAGEDERLLGKLAYHLSHAEIHEHALDVLLKAGDQARQYAVTESLWYYERALHHLEPLTRDGEIRLCRGGDLIERVRSTEAKRWVLEKLGYVYKELSRFTDAIKAFEWVSASITDEVARHDQSLLVAKVSAFCQVALVMLSMDKKIEALRRIESEPLYASVESLPLEAQQGIIFALTNIYSALNDWEKVEEGSRKLLDWALEQKDRMGMLSCSFRLFDLCYRLDRRQEARPYAQMALEIAEQIDGTLALFYTNSVKERLAWMEGDFARSAQYLEQLLHIGRAHFSLTCMDEILAGLTQIYLYVDPFKSLRYARKRWQLVRGTEMRDAEIAARCDITRAFLEVGETDQARKWIQEIVERAGWEPFSGLSALTELALLKGDGAEALRWACEYERRVLDRRHPNLQYLSLIARFKGLAYLQLEDRESAQKEAERLQRLIEAGGALCEVGLAHGDHALLLKALEEREPALSAYQEAQDILQKGGAVWRAAKLSEAFEEWVEEAQPSLSMSILKEKSMPLRIRMFGGFQVERYGQPVPEEEWRSDKAKNVLKVLVLSRGKPVVRDVLLELFWRDMEPKRASHNLNSALYTIRRILEPNRPRRAPSKYLTTTRDVLRFETRSDIWVDVVAFEQHVHRIEELQEKGQHKEAVSEAQKAVDTYRGELLPEDRYEDWCLIERERVREQCGNVLLQLGRYYYQCRAFDAAQAQYEKVLELDPYKEAALRMLMGCLIECSRRNEALLRYQAFARLLWKELGVEPEPSTKALYDQLKRGTS